MKKSEKPDGQEVVTLHSEMRRRFLARKKGFTEIFKTFERTFLGSYTKSLEFKRFINTYLPHDDKKHPFVEIVLEAMRRQNLRPQPELMRLLRLERKIYEHYWHNISIMWKDLKKSIAIFPLYSPKEPVQETYNLVNGQIQDDTLSDEQFLKFGYTRPVRPHFKRGCIPISILRIKQVPPVNPGPFEHIMERIKTEPTPVAIEYITKDRGKILLVSLPENVDTTTFLKVYGKTITAIHNDFYRIKFRGAPRKKAQLEAMIRQALEKYKGRNFSMSKLYGLVGQEVDKSPETLRRNYKLIFRKFKKGDAKISK